MSVFDWAQYLTLAEDLREGRGSTVNEEARLRSAVSRAYYTAFCLARDLLIDEGEISSARRDEPRLHHEVATRFKSRSPMHTASSGIDRRRSGTQRRPRQRFAFLDQPPGGLRGGGEREGRSVEALAPRGPDICAKHVP